MLDKFLFPRASFRLVLHWLVTSCQLSSSALNKLWLVLFPQSGCDALKVSPVQFINFSVGTEDAKLPLQLTFSVILCCDRFHDINTTRRMYHIKTIWDSSSLGKILPKSSM